jgi:glucans biosynthesis protein C
MVPFSLNVRTIMNLNQTLPMPLAALPACPNPLLEEASLEKPGPRRFFALDSLRASMMLLGIYLHAVVGYSREGGWPFKDPHPTSIYDWTLGYIHAFRMPLFYVMAGFFAALLTYRRGLKSFLWNRTQRILVPFAVGWTLMFPVVILLAAYARVIDQPHPWGKAFHVLTSGDFLQHLHPLHLWFLEYLILLYVIQTIATLVLPKVLPHTLLSAVNEVFRWVLKCPWKPLILAGPMFFALCLTRGGSLEDPPGFIPVFRILAPYIMAFAFGWFLYKNVDLLDTMQHWARTEVAATGGVLVLLFFIGNWMDHHAFAARFIVAGAVSVVMWLLICGLTGVFLRYLDRPMPRLRYLADSSYWLYLVHMLVLMAFQMLLRSVSWPAAIKVWIVLLLAVPVMLLSYHYCVRPTFIGQVLNGRRYPTTLAKPSSS